jgi:hypothetical protein
MKTPQTDFKRLVHFADYFFFSARQKQGLEPDKFPVEIFQGRGTEGDTMSFAAVA